MAPDAESVTPAQFGLGDDWVPLEEAADLLRRGRRAGVRRPRRGWQVARDRQSLQQIEMEIGMCPEGVGGARTPGSDRESLIRASNCSRMQEEDATTLRCSSIAIGSAFAQPIPCAVSASASAKDL